MRHLTTLCLLVLLAAPAAAIEDLNDWTLIEDPEHPGMSATVDSPLQVTLRATGAVPTATDIGYASVDGADVANSTSGYYFDPSSSFEVAVDFDLSSMSLVGGGAIGFGVGEDVAGADSAGITLGFLNGAPALFATGGRVDNIDQGVNPLAVAAFGTGRFFAEYDSLTGDIVLGVNATPGAAAPSVISTLSAFQDQWDEEPLLVSFFLRSQAVSPFPALTSGEATAVFSNFEVLSGSPIAVVPEPTTLLTTLGALGVLAVRQGR